MKDEYKIYVVYLLTIIFLLVIGTVCNGQTSLTDKEFNKTKKGLSIVEFFADWNKDNTCDWIKDITNVKSYRMNLDSKTAKDYEIKVLPTLIIFYNGKEIKRFEGNINFQLCPKRTPKKVQKAVNDLLTIE